MSAPPRSIVPPSVSRRALLGTVARWTVPTMVTITLGARVLEAVPSCPPCTRRSGTKCKACSVQQILNCQCEPCLGPPYCTGVAAAAAFSQSGGVAGGAGPGSSAGAPGSVPMPGVGGGYDSPEYQRLRSQALRGYSRDNPLGAPLYSDPFSAGRNSGQLRSPFDRGGLYGRLRGDSTSSGRRP